MLIRGTARQGRARQGVGRGRGMAGAGYVECFGVGPEL